MPQKTSRSIKMELEILNFGYKSVVRLSTAIDKTIENCTDFYKGMCSIHHQCQVLAGNPKQDFPAREQHLKNLQDRLQTGEESTSQIECISEEAIGCWIVKVSAHMHMLEELLSQNTPKVKEIESQLSKHEIAVRVLEPAEYRIINEEYQAWDVFIKSSTRPT